VHVVAVGGSDAGISAALRARELDPSVEVSVVVADEYPNFSICGIPYHVSGDVRDWRTLAHRSIADLQAAGLQLLLNTTAKTIEVDTRRLSVATADGRQSRLPYDELVIATGATPVRPPIGGLNTLGPDDGVFLLHTMDDTFALTEFIDTRHPATAIVVGAGYLGLEMAEALTMRGIRVTQVEMLTEVLPTVDPSLGRLVRDRLTKAGVEAHTDQGATPAGEGPNRLRRRRQPHIWVPLRLSPVSCTNARGGRARRHRVVALPYLVGGPARSGRHASRPGAAASDGEHGRRARAPNATMIGPTGGQATVSRDRIGPDHGPVFNTSSPTLTTRGRSILGAKVIPKQDKMSDVSYSGRPLRDPLPR
jgi:hypothetical protein